MCCAIFRDEKKIVQRGGRIAIQTDWLVRFRDVAEDFFCYANALLLALGFMHM